MFFRFSLCIKSVQSVYAFPYSAREIPWEKKEVYRRVFIVNTFQISFYLKFVCFSRNVLKFVFNQNSYTPNINILRLHEKKKINTILCTISGIHIQFIDEDIVHFVYNYVDPI